MARYIKQSPRQVQSMYNPMDIGFYAGILNSAQQNLNEASKIQAAYEDDIYNIKTFDPTTKEAYIKKAQEAIGNELDRDFVSPANVAKGVARASKVLAPFKNINEKQLELAKAFQEDKRRLGANFWGNDPTTTSLMKETGELLTPEELQYDVIDASDIDKAFILKSKEQLDKPYFTSPSRRVTVNGQTVSAPEGKYVYVEGKGLDEPEIDQLYNPTTGRMSAQVANQLLDDNPMLVKIEGSREKALEKLMNRNYLTANAYGNTRNVQFMDDPSYLNAYERSKITPPPTPPPIIPFKPTPLATTPVQTTSVSKDLGFDKNGKINLNFVPASKEANAPTYVSTFGTPVGNTTSNYPSRKREEAITTLSTIRKNTRYDQLKPSAMSYDEYKAMAEKNGLSTKEDAYRNWLEKTNSYIVSSQQLAEAYDEGIQNLTKAGGGFYQVPNDVGSELGKTVASELSSTRMYALDGKDVGTATVETLADKLNISEENLRGQLQNSNFRVAGVTSRGKESGMMVFDIADSKGKAHTVLASSNNTFKEGMKKSNAIYNFVINGKSGIVTDEKGEEISHYSNDGSSTVYPTYRFTYNVTPLLDVHNKTLNPSIQIITSQFNGTEYVPISSEPVNLGDIEQLEMRNVIQTGQVKSDIDFTKETIPNI